MQFKISDSPTPEAKVRKVFISLIPNITPFLHSFFFPLSRKNLFGRLRG